MPRKRRANDCVNHKRRTSNDTKSSVIVRVILCAIALAGIDKAFAQPNFSTTLEISKCKL